MLLWQWLTVHYNYRDDWTALYYTGALSARAAGDRATSRSTGSPDRQATTGSSITSSRMIRGCGTGRRVRGQSPPALATDSGCPRWHGCSRWAQSDFVDSAYFGVLLGFVLLGAYWLSRYLERYNLPPGWGAAFALVPAVLISMDRATVDVALAALCVGFALYAAADPSWRIYPVLALAPLARETGLCLTVAFAVVQLRRRNWQGALLAAATTLPFCAWLLFLHSTDHA